jgi:hypothetical protein
MRLRPLTMGFYTKKTAIKATISRLFVLKYLFIKNLAGSDPRAFGEFEGALLGFIAQGL